MERDLYNSSGEAVAYIANDQESSIYTWNGEAKAVTHQEIEAILSIEFICSS